MEKDEVIKALKDGITDGEKLLFEFFNEMSGSFVTCLFKTIMSADSFNLSRLAKGFPEEVKAVMRYRNEPGYWESLQSRIYRSYNKR